MNRSIFRLFVFLVFTGLNVSADDKYADAYVCTKGKSHFYASTPLEDIEGTSNNTICVFNTKSKKIFAKVQMTSYAFHDRLMQEHFNENYMESDKFPFGILDAEIVENLDFTKDGVYDITLNGTFEVHGVKKEREIKGKLTIKNGQPFSATAAFDVKLADHDIRIPTAVVTKIAEVVKVDVDFSFEKYKK